MKISDRGISLLEVMVAMILLALGLLTMAPMVVLSIEGNNISRDVMSVSSLAKDKLEYYKGLNVMPAVPYTLNETGLDGGYNRITTIRDNSIDASIPVGLYEIDVVLQWNDKSGVARSAVYSTYVEK